MLLGHISCSFSSRSIRQSCSVSLDRSLCPIYWSYQWTETSLYRIKCIYEVLLTAKQKDTVSMLTRWPLSIHELISWNVAAVMRLPRNMAPTRPTCWPYLSWRPCGIHTETKSSKDKEVSCFTPTFLTRAVVSIAHSWRSPSKARQTSSAEKSVQTFHFTHL